MAVFHCTSMEIARWEGGGGWECGYFDRAKRPRFDPQKPGINSEAATKLCSLREVSAVGECTKFSFIFNPYNPRL